jgi:hypothetical protein
LKREWRTPGGIARVRAIAATLGIDVTGVGDAAVSGTLSPSLCELLFGVTAAGDQADIAEPLCRLIESVSILPAVRRP